MRLNSVKSVLSVSTLLIASGLAVLVATSVVAAPKGGGSVDPDVQGAQGLDCLKKNDYKNAYKLLVEAVKSRPGSVGFQYGLGVSAAQMQQTDAAANAFAAVVVMSPKHYAIHNQVANLLFKSYKLTPYSCISPSINPPGLVRWHNDSMPLNVCISDGKELPAKFNQQMLQAEDIRTLYTWLRSAELMGRLAPAKSYKPEFKRSAINGVALWEGAAPGRVSFQMTDDHRTADVVVFWTDILFNNGAYTYLPKGAGTPVVIIVSLGGLANYDKAACDKIVANFVAHEFGHALGLQHSLHDTDMMYSNYDATADFRNKVVSVSDKLTLRTLYSVPAKSYFQGAPKKK